MARSSLDRRFDRILEAEEAGQLSSRGGSRALRKLLGNHLAVIGLLIFGIILFASIFAPLLTEHDPLKINLRAILQPPSAEHWFGTDTTGRDVFARVLYGGRISILVGLGSALIAAIIGVGIGCYAGYKGGWIDVIAMRVSEIFMSFPQIILVLLLVSIIGQSLINLIVIFVASGWGTMFRMARAKMLSLREEEYVQA
ncbi:MAG: ABC transporter permease, partial [Geminicoccaceae bacterium]